MRPSRTRFVAALSLPLAACGVTLDAASVGGVELADGAVDAPKLAPGAVGPDQLADRAVTPSKLAVGAVGDEALADGAVRSRALATGAIGPDQLGDRAVQERHLDPTILADLRVPPSSIDDLALAPGAVAARHLAPGAVGPEAIADAAIEPWHLAPGAVDDLAIGDRALQPRHFGDSAVQGRAIAGRAVDGSKVALGSLTGEHIDDGSIGAQDLAADSVGTTQLQRFVSFGTSDLNGAVNVFNGQGSVEGAVRLSTFTSGTGLVFTRYQSDNRAAVFSQHAGSLKGYMGVNDDKSACCDAGMYVDSEGRGVVFGDVKSFVVPHPEDRDLVLVYACQEGPEASAYARGTATLREGRAVIDLPDHFAMVVVDGGLTVQLTPTSAESRGLAATAVSPGQLVVQELAGGRGTYAFHWRVEGVREGYEDWRVVRRAEEFAPSDEQPQAGRR